MVVLDQHAAELFAKNINMMVPYYLMAAWGYYKKDRPIFTDAFFDEMSKTMADRWDDIEHFHKHLIKKGDLEAGTYLGEYPERVKGAYDALCKEHGI